MPLATQLLLELLYPSAFPPSLFCVTQDPLSSLSGKVRVSRVRDTIAHNVFQQRRIKTYDAPIIKVGAKASDNWQAKEKCVSIV